MRAVATKKRKEDLPVGELESIATAPALPYFVDGDEVVHIGLRAGKGRGARCVTASDVGEGVLRNGGVAAANGEALTDWAVVDMRGYRWRVVSDDVLTAVETMAKLRREHRRVTSDDVLAAVETMHRPYAW